MNQDAPAQPTATVLLSGFVVDLAGEELRDVHGERVDLRPRSFAVLRLLAANPGRIVTKQEILDKVWNGAAVSEDSLTQCIADIRRKIGDGERRIIRTIPSRGFQLTSDAGPQPFAPPDAALAPPGDRPSIAVLPFENMSGDPEQCYFADGVVEDIITALARFPSLFVIARNSSFTYKGRPVDVRQVGRELGVRYVLEGSVRRSEDRLRISGQLVQTDTGMHVWAERYDGALADIFALQDEMTASVVGALVPNLQRAEVERARKTPPASLTTYDLYLHALAARDLLTRDGIAQALQLVERALALDPTFVSAAILAAGCWTLRFSEGWSPTAEAHAESVRYARLAVSLDAHNAEALAVLARRIAQAERNYAEARSLAERAVAINPNSSLAWRHSGFVFVYTGEPELALDYLQRAVRLSPYDSWSHDSWSGIALALIQLHRDQEAVVAGRRAVQLNPRWSTSWRALTAGLALAGHLSEAKDAVRRLLELDPSCSISAVAARYGLSDQATVRYFDGLRRAGLPE